MTTVADAPAVGLDVPGHPLWLAFQWEIEKLSAQFRTRLAATVCLLGPVAFAIGLSFSSTVPADTLFGRWGDDSGYALPLVVLGFAGSWGFPLLTCLVAGDIFSTEDQHHTWAMLLTRSLGRRTVFAGKVLAAAAYSLAVTVLLGLSSLAAGVVVIGRQPLVGLSGNLVAPGHALWLVLLSWLCALPSVLCFAAMGVAISVASRHSLAGIVGPTVAGLVLQLALLVGGIGVAANLLPNSTFIAWHGVWAAPDFTGPLAAAVPVAVGYSAVFLLAAWAIFRRRDFAGA